MNPPLNELAGILEQEIAVAEELERNLSAQKQAIIDWNIDALLAETEAREPWLRRLDELERNRLNCLAQAGRNGGSIKLRQLVARLPQNTPDAARLRVLQERARNIFTRLQADEQTTHSLMANILGHIHEAFGALAQPAVSRYGESGVSESQRPSSALLQSRA